MDSWREYNADFDFDKATPIIREQSTWKGHFNFAYDLVRFMQPKTIVELGSYMGGSFFSMCQAVKDAALDTKVYAIDTWEGDPHSGYYDNKVHWMVETISESYYPNVANMIRSTFDNALGRFADGSVDLLHIDGYHTYEAASHDYTTWLPKLRENGVVLFHDIAEVQQDFGVWQFWEELKAIHPHLEFSHSSGLGVLFPKGLNINSTKLINEKERIQSAYPSFLAAHKRADVSKNPITNPKKNFVFYFWDFDDIHFVKDIGIIPFVMGKYFDYDVEIILTVPPKVYPNNEKFTNNMKIHFAPSQDEINEIFKTADVLMLCGFYEFNAAQIINFKDVNPEGKIYLKLDFNLEWLIDLDPYPAVINAFRQADLISVESRELQYLMKKRWDLPTIYVPNGFYNFFDRKLVRATEKENIILTVGRLDEKKNSFLLLDAFAKISDEVPDWKLVMVGHAHPDFTDYLSGLLEASPHLKERIVLTGSLSYEDVVPYYRMSKILCLPSREEAAPNVIPEAMGRGCYIVATDVGNALDVLNYGQFGQIVPNDNLSYLQTSLLNICQDEDLLNSNCEQVQSYCNTTLNWVNLCEAIHAELDHGFAAKKMETEIIYRLRRLENHINPARNAREVWELVKRAEYTIEQLKRLIEYHCYESFYVRKYLLENLPNVSYPLVEAKKEKINKTSIVVLTFNNLQYNKGVIESIRKYTPPGTYEIIVVDNASTDGTREWLANLNDIKLILNNENVGFPKGCNMGIALAEVGNDVLLLNNDIEVTENWLDNLQRALYSSDEIGAVQGLDAHHFGQQVDDLGFVIDWQTDDTTLIHRFASKNNVSDAEKWRYTNFLTGYCLLIKNKVLLEVGLLDEQFSPGNYEDDDWSFRILQAGYYLLKCYDTFIHHFGSKSFRKDTQHESSYWELMRVNQDKFFRKWGFNAWDKTAASYNLVSLIEADVSAPIEVLQLGSGLGLTLLEVKNKFPNAVLCAVNQNQFHNFVTAGVFNVKTADPTVFPFDFTLGRFDVILADDIITTTKNPAAFLAQVRQYLKPGGKLIFKFDNILHISNIDAILSGRWQTSNLPFLTTTNSFLTGPDVVELGTAAGYNSIDAGHVLWTTDAEEELIMKLEDTTGNQKGIDYRTKTFLFGLHNSFLTQIPSGIIQCHESEREFTLNKIGELQESNDFSTTSVTNLKGVSVSYSNYFARGTLEWMQPSINDALRSVHIMNHDQHRHLITLIDSELGIYSYKFEQHFWDYSIVYQVHETHIDVLYWAPFFTPRTTEIQNQLSMIATNYPEVMTTTQTIDYIIKNKCSIARFGDGEYSLAQGHSIDFQSSCSVLQNRLLEILGTNSRPDFLVAITEFSSIHEDVPNQFGELSVWEYYWYKHFDTLKPHFAPSIYGNATVSRQAVFIENELPDIKKIWADRDIVIVTGTGSRFELLPVLFDNIKSVKYIDTPAINAFDSYSDILNHCLQVDQDALFLLSCGPTATVLAYDLANDGYQALDIGHLPNSYRQYLGHITSPEALPFVSEVKVDE